VTFDKIQAPVQVNVIGRSSTHTLTVLKSSSAFGRLHEECCGCMRARERVSRGRVCAAMKGAENQYSECSVGGSDVAGIITGWQSI